MAFSATGAKTALTDAIAAVDGLEDALVREGLPTDAPTQSDRVFVLRRIEDGARDRVTEQRTFTEEFTIRVLVEVRTYGDDDGGPSEERAETIKDLIDGVIEDDPELGGAVRDAVIQDFNSDTGATEDGWITKLLIGVRVGGFV